MKKLMILVSVFVSLNSHSKIILGNEGANGGDEVAIDFQQMLSSAVQWVEENPSVLPASHSIEAIRKLVEEVSILIVEEPLIVQYDGDDQESVAINIALKNQIQINRTRWQKIYNYRIREAIALHELLSLAGIERTGFYPVSSKYIANFGLASAQFSSLISTPAATVPKVGFYITKCNHTETMLERKNGKKTVVDHPDVDLNLVIKFSSPQSGWELIFPVSTTTQWDPGLHYGESIVTPLNYGLQPMELSERSGHAVGLLNGKFFEYQVPTKRTLEKKEVSHADGNRVTTITLFEAGAGNVPGKIISVNKIRSVSEDISLAEIERFKLNPEEETIHLKSSSSCMTQKLALDNFLSLIGTTRSADDIKSIYDASTRGDMLELEASKNRILNSTKKRLMEFKSQKKTQRLRSANRKRKIGEAQRSESNGRINYDNMDALDKAIERSQREELNDRLEAIERKLNERP